VTGIEVIIGNCLAIYLTLLSKYGASKIMGLQPWLLGVTWRHRSCDYSTSSGRIPMPGPLWPCVYLAPLWRYTTSKITGSRPWHCGVMWRHRSRDHSKRGGRLPMGGPLWPCVYHHYWDIAIWSSSKKALPKMEVDRSLVGPLVVNITLISYTPLCYVRNVACKE